MFNSEKSIKCKVISSASDYWCSISVLEVDAAVEGGGDASVNGLTKDVTDGLFDLGVDSLVKIFIWVSEGLFLLSAGLTGEVVIEFTCTSAIYWLTVASSLTLNGEVVVSLVARLVDFVSLVGELTSDIPVLLLVGSNSVVGGSS